MLRAYDNNNKERSSSKLKVKGSSILMIVNAEVKARAYEILRLRIYLFSVMQKFLCEIK